MLIWNVNIGIYMETTVIIWDLYENNKTGITSRSVWYHNYYLLIVKTITVFCNRFSAVTVSEIIMLFKYYMNRQSIPPESAYCEVC